MIEFIKTTLKSNRLGQAIYPALNKLYRLYSVPARRRKLRKYGYKLLDELFTISEKERIGLFPLFGSLLGFERDGGFIAWDDDIDVGIIDEGDNVKRCVRILVEKYGYEFYHGLKYDGKLAEFTLKRMNITIDFFPMHHENGGLMTKAFYWEENCNYDNPYANSTYYMRHPMIERLVPMMINGVKIMVPENKEAVLVAEFGSDWRKPDPGFSEKTLPTCIPKDGFGYAITEDEFMNLVGLKNN